LQKYMMENPYNLAISYFKQFDFLLAVHP